MSIVRSSIASNSNVCSSSGRCSCFLLSVYLPPPALLISFDSLGVPGGAPTRTPAASASTMPENALPPGTAASTAPEDAPPRPRRSFPSTRGLTTRRRARLGDAFCSARQSRSNPSRAQQSNLGHCYRQLDVRARAASPSPFPVLSPPRPPAAHSCARARREVPTNQDGGAKLIIVGGRGMVACEGIWGLVIAPNLGRSTRTRGATAFRCSHC